MKSINPAENIYQKRSHPARGAWIEIMSPLFAFLISGVAPRKGCVD